jgi:hypothetical protein
VDGQRILREYIDSDGEIGVLFCGKSFRYNKKDTMARKGEEHREFESSDHYPKF